MTKSKIAWKNLRKNYAYVLPSSFALGLGVFLVSAFFISMMNILETLQGDSHKIVVLIVLVFAMFKLVSYIGINTLYHWAATINDAMVDQPRKGRY